MAPKLNKSDKFVNKELPPKIKQNEWWKRKDSNFTSLLASFILFYFGDGPVRGFALTLALGIIVSLFSALFVVRTLLMLIDVLPDNPNEPKGLKKLLSFGRKK